MTTVNRLPFSTVSTTERPAADLQPEAQCLIQCEFVKIEVTGSENVNVDPYNLAARPQDAIEPCDTDDVTQVPTIKVLAFSVDDESHIQNLENDVKKLRDVKFDIAYVEVKHINTNVNNDRLNERVTRIFEATFPDLDINSQLVIETGNSARGIVTPSASVSTHTDQPELSRENWPTAKHKRSDSLCSITSLESPTKHTRLSSGDDDVDEAVGNEFMSVSSESSEHDEWQQQQHHKQQQQGLHGARQLNTITGSPTKQIRKSTSILTMSEDKTGACKRPNEIQHQQQQQPPEQQQQLRTMVPVEPNTRFKLPSYSLGHAISYAIEDRLFNVLETVEIQLQETRNKVTGRHVTAVDQMLFEIRGLYSKGITSLCDRKQRARGKALPDEFKKRVLDDLKSVVSCGRLYGRLTVILKKDVPDAVSTLRTSIILMLQEFKMDSQEPIDFVSQGELKQQRCTNKGF